MSKPFEREQLIFAVRRALEYRRPKTENDTLRSRIARLEKGSILWLDKRRPQVRAVRLWMVRGKAACLLATVKRDQHLGLRRAAPRLETERAGLEVGRTHSES